MLHLAVGKSESKYTPANLIQLVVAKLNCAGRELLFDARRKFQRCYRFPIAHDLPLALLPLNYRSASVARHLADGISRAWDMPFIERESCDRDHVLGD